MPRWHEDLTALERLSLIDLSYSRINTYDMCALQFFYSYIIGEPQTFGAAATLGNVIHDTLEDNVGAELEIDEMIKSFEMHKEERDPENKIGTELIQAGIGMLQEFYDLYKDKEFNVIAAEKYFEIVIGNALVRGYIDRIDRVDDHTINICDYKSGKRMVPYKDIATNLQLIIYVLACSLMFPEVDTFHAELYYLRNQQSRSHTFKREDLADLELRLVKVIWKIFNDHHHHSTPKTYICGFCDHAETGACTLGVMRNKERANR